MIRSRLLRRLSSRIARQISGEEREPVGPDYLDDVRIGVLIFLSGAGIASLTLMVIFGDRITNLICGS